MRKFIAIDAKGKPAPYMPGLPARDLTEEEWDQLIREELISEGAPEAAWWEKVEDQKETRIPKRTADQD